MTTSTRTSLPTSAGRTASEDVGVVIVTRNRCERLLGALERLAGLPERPSVVVVDNASTDGTADAVRQRHPGVRLLEMSRNLGAAGRNAGAVVLRTAYIAFCDDDSWWEPGALAEAARCFDEHPRLGLIAAATRVGPDNVPDPIDKDLGSALLGTEPDLPGPTALGFLACAAVVRRQAFLGVGGFHPLLHLGAEEELLAMDLDAAGWGLAFCPQVVAHHDPDPGSRDGRVARMRRNELLIAWMRRPVTHAVRRTARLVRAALPDKEARRALAGAALLLPAALRCRNRLPNPVERRVRTLTQATAARGRTR
jgi:GT2 family glycosyltransferase